MVSETKDTKKRVEGVPLIQIRSSNTIKGQTSSISILGPPTLRENSRQGKFTTQEQDSSELLRNSYGAEIHKAHQIRLLPSSELGKESEFEIQTAQLMKTPLAQRAHTKSNVGTLLNHESDLIDVVNAGCGTDEIDLINGGDSFNQLQERDDINLTDEHMKLLAEIDLMNQSSQGGGVTSQFRATNLSGNDFVYGDVSPIRPRKLPNHS